MAKTKIDNELSSLVSEIISTQAMSDESKEPFRRLAREAMQVYSRSRTFAWMWGFYAILAAIAFILAIVCACMSPKQVFSYVFPITVGVIGLIVFGILTRVFRARYRARLSNLSGDFLAKARNKKATKHSVVPMVCVVGPFINSYRGTNVYIRSEDYDGMIPSYSNLSMVFFENRGGGRFLVQAKKKIGGVSLNANECSIVIADITKAGIVFQKIPVKVPKSAFVEETAPAPAPTSVVPAPVATAPAAAPVNVAVPVKPAETDQTPNELFEVKRFGELDDPLSIPAGKVAFFVLKDAVYDMLKPGDYGLSLDAFPRLKAANPEAFDKGMARLVLLDSERVYQIAWKLDEDIHAKGDVEFRISNARLFLNCVYEDALKLKALFEAHIQSILKPLLIKELRASKSDDFEVIEKGLLKSLGDALDCMGLHIEFIGISAFWKEDASQEHSDRHCIHCGKAIPSDSVFCAYCGKQQDGNICSSCGAEIPDGAAFCPKCGSKRL